MGSSGKASTVTTSGPPASGTFAVGDHAFSGDGLVYVCTVAGTPGTWVTPADTRDALATGEEVVNRRFVTNNSSAPLTSGTMRLTYFTARKTETTTQTRIVSGNTAAGATPTLFRVGLYSIAANGDATLVASTPNDTALFAASGTAYTKSWSVSYAKVAGVRYAFGVLCVTGATAPQICANSMNAVNEPSTGLRLSGAITSLSDLPGSYVDSTVAATGTSPYGVILP